MGAWLPLLVDAAGLAVAGLWLWLWLVRSWVVAGAGRCCRGRRWFGGSSCLAGVDAAGCLAAWGPACWWQVACWSSRLLPGCWLLSAGWSRAGRQLGFWLGSCWLLVLAGWSSMLRLVLAGWLAVVCGVGGCCCVVVVLGCGRWLGCWLGAADAGSAVVCAGHAS